MPPPPHDLQTRWDSGSIETGTPGTSANRLCWISLIGSYRRAVWACDPLYDPWARHGHDEFPAAVAIRLLLTKNLIGEIPAQQEHVVGHFLQQLFGAEDREVFSGHVETLFMNVAVHYEIHKLHADADVVDHR